MKREGCNVQPWNTDASPSTYAAHHGVENAGGLLSLRRVSAAAARFEADGVNAAIDLRVAEDISGGEQGVSAQRNGQSLRGDMSCGHAPQLLIDGQRT